MAILSASYLGHSFGAHDLFGGISVSIPDDGRIGLVGPNGIGKTTLLLILAGIIEPATGNVYLARGTRLGYLPQEATEAFSEQEHSVFEEMLLVFEQLRAEGMRLRRLEEAMASGAFSDELFESYSKLQVQFELAGGYDYELRIKQVLTGLGLGQEHWSLPLKHLSGGQKTRVLLARLLLERPNLLILDEPTNHLDVEAMEWLEGVLRTWEGAILLVSHDRYFLDKVTNAIWEMSQSGIETYRGHYSGYLQQRQERWERRQREFEALKARLDKEMDFIRRHIAGQRTQMAQGKLSRLAREVEAIRAGGLTVLQALRSKGWLRLSTEVNLRRPPGTVAELQQAINGLQMPAVPSTLHVPLRASHRSGNIVLRTRELQIGYPGSPLFTADDIELRRQERAILIGPNGSGKTTFLRTILGHIKPVAGEIQLGASLLTGYFAQAHESFDENSTLLEELLRHRHMNVSEARSYLARLLFRQDDVYKRVNALSGGERGRLALALLALQEANFLLMDEPTNHLDIPSQEALQTALEQFEGTILLVSHDRYLADRLATQVWAVENGCLRVHQGGYQEYVEQRTMEAERLKEAAATTRSMAGEEAPSNGSQPSKNWLRKRAEELENLEALIGKMEAKLDQVGEALQLATRAQTFDKIQSLSVEYNAIESHLAELFETWERLTHE
jgi:ATP-binding cassette subfamily F protein 3